MCRRLRLGTLRSLCASMEAIVELVGGNLPQLLAKRPVFSWTIWSSVLRNRVHRRQSDDSELPCMSARRPRTQRAAGDPWLIHQAAALEDQLSQHSRRTGQSRLTHVSLIAGWERVVCEKAEKPVLRMLAFWKCLSVWGALPFSDHRGMEPQNFILACDGQSGTLTRTKTTGAYKK